MTSDEFKSEMEESIGDSKFEKKFLSLMQEKANKDN